MHPSLEHSVLWGSVGARIQSLLRFYVFISTKRRRGEVWALARACRACDSDGCGDNGAGDGGDGGGGFTLVVVVMVTMVVSLKRGNRRVKRRTSHSLLPSNCTWNLHGCGYPLPPYYQIHRLKFMKHHQNPEPSKIPFQKMENCPFKNPVAGYSAAMHDIPQKQKLLVEVKSWKQYSLHWINKTFVSDKRSAKPKQKKGNIIFLFACVKRLLDWSLEGWRPSSSKLNQDLKDSSLEVEWEKMTHVVAGTCQHCTRY